MNHRPSVIAAAATLVAANRDFTIQEMVIEMNVFPINVGAIFILNGLSNTIVCTIQYI